MFELKIHHFDNMFLIFLNFLIVNSIKDLNWHLWRHGGHLNCYCHTLRDSNTKHKTDCPTEDFYNAICMPIGQLLLGNWYTERYLIHLFSLRQSSCWTSVLWVRFKRPATILKLFFNILMCGLNIVFLYFSNKNFNVLKFVWVEKNICFYLPAFFFWIFFLDRFWHYQ